MTVASLWHPSDDNFDDVLSFPKGFVHIADIEVPPLTDEIEYIISLTSKYGWWKTKTVTLVDLDEKHLRRSIVGDMVYTSLKQRIMLTVDKWIEVPWVN